ncbi:MAG: RluA family pseudouridine synthase [Lachnospiraceae bacterium]|nr:RluA family pseudouridine synthase [Lachnospiraceae bacterium]
MNHSPVAPAGTPLCLPHFGRTLCFRITETDDGCPAGKFLRGQGFSHRLLARLKRTPGVILLNQSSIPAGLPLHTGDELQVTIPYDFHRYRYFEDEMHPERQLESLPLPEIVFEDEDILVVSKPAGMPTHPSQGHHGDTLAEICALLLARRPDWASAIEELRSECPSSADVHSASITPAAPSASGTDRAVSSSGSICAAPEHGEVILPALYCIGRLDRDTSGLLVLGKHAHSAGILSAAMKQRKIHRFYQAVVHGRLTEAGTVEAPIAREPGSVIKRQVHFSDGEAAITHYHPLAYHSTTDRTLVELKLETGRTHQIRVHMAWLGHPLVGDDLYGGAFVPAPGRQGQHLHSCSLSFVHPLTGQALSFCAPLPEDMKAAP